MPSKLFSIWAPIALQRISLFGYVCMESRLPTSGTVIADFESVVEPIHIQVITDKQLKTLEPQFHKKTISDDNRLSLVGMIAPHYYFKCDQVGDKWKLLIKSDLFKADFGM